MSKFVRVAVLFLATVVAVNALQCYFCNDDDDRNCEGTRWGVLNDCRHGCMTYSVKLRQKPRHSLVLYLFTRYRRGCAGQGGCEQEKKSLADAWGTVYEFHCQECKGDLCNNRANHPGVKIIYEKIDEYSK